MRPFLPPISLKPETVPTKSFDVKTDLIFPGKWNGKFDWKDFSDPVSFFPDAKSNNRVEMREHKIAKLNVILKTVDITDYKKDMKYIEREVAALNKVRESPYKFIIGYYGCGVESSVHRRYFLCTEVMEGSLLSLRLKLGRVYDDPMILRYVNYGMVMALDYLYSGDKNIIHRDIKPDNILFQTSARSSGNKGEKWLCVKLTDFGISRTLLDNGASTAMDGTLKYRAPERKDNLQLADLEQTDRKYRVYGIETDIWSLGLTVLEMALEEYPLEERVKANGDLKRVLSAYCYEPFTIIDEDKLQTKAGTSRVRNRILPLLIKYLEKCIAPAADRAKDYATLKELTYVKDFVASAGELYDKKTGKLKYNEQR
uniref:mitogen-activated protein kinase kinase n=1 Tax=Panagrellus redivivus TaxID=6233 RepID=A0A7E4V7Q3_PANRE